MGGRRHQLLLLLWVTAMLINARGETADLRLRSLAGFSRAEYSDEKQLINDLQGVLERLKNNRFLSHGKKLSLLPTCDAGEPCALRKGARIGTLCNCQRPRTCNSFMLRCL